MLTTTRPVTVTAATDGHDVVLCGRIDMRTAPDIRDAVHAVLAAGEGQVRLNLADAEITDATGLGVIVHLHRRATRLQRPLFVVGGSDRTARLLRACHLQRILVPA